MRQRTSLWRGQDNETRNCMLRVLTVPWRDHIMTCIRSRSIVPLHCVSRHLAFQQRKIRKEERKREKRRQNKRNKRPVPVHPKCQCGWSQATASSPSECRARSWSQRRGEGSLKGVPFFYSGIRNVIFYLAFTKAKS